MEIPVQNIYYLLCYAWNQLDEGKLVDVESTDSNKLIDLFAKVLNNGIIHLIKRGFYRSYIPYTDEISTIKGKLDFNHSLKRNLFLTGKSFCSFDDFNHNAIHNQILKTTLDYLIKCKELDDNLKMESLLLFRYFHDINCITLSKRMFNQIQIHRNNYFYLFLLNICEIIYENLLVDEQTGNTKFKDFIRDENKMAKLFENFVRNFYRMEQSCYNVSREIINWHIETKDTSFLPRMETDISLISKNRKIIIDTKFYKDAFQRNFDVKKFHSNNLYQLYSYLKQIEYKDKLSQDAESILLYPAVETKIDFIGNIEGHIIKILTINLNQDWRDIKKDLLSIIN